MMMTSAETLSELCSTRESGPPPPPREDALEPLARDAAGGNAKAQRELCRRLGPPILSVLRAILGPSSPDLADQLQESLVALLGALPTFRGESSVSHFACRIAMKRALDARRKTRVIASVMEAAASQPPPPADLPGDHLVSLRLREVLRELMSALPAAQAETLAMRVVLGYSVAEIGDETQVPLNTVRSRLLLAKKALKERILADATLRELAEIEP
jgi:RNA polymerase sigma-70 factor, ECF subfamily